MRTRPLTRYGCNCGPVFVGVNFMYSIYLSSHLLLLSVLQICSQKYTFSICVTNKCTHRFTIYKLWNIWWNSNFNCRLVFPHRYTLWFLSIPFNNFQPAPMSILNDFRNLSSHKSDISTCWQINPVSTNEPSITFWFRQPVRLLFFALVLIIWDFYQGKPSLFSIS